MPSNYKNQKYSSIRSDCLKRGELFEDPEFPANRKSLSYSRDDADIVWKRPKELCKVPRLVIDGVTTDDIQQGEELCKVPRLVIDGVTTDDIQQGEELCKVPRLVIDEVTTDDLNQGEELCKVPRLVIDGVTTDDLNQGEVGNMWFVTACASIVREKKLFNTVVPDLKTQEWNEREDKNTYSGAFHFTFWRYGEWVDVIVDDRLPTRGDKLVFCHSKSRNEFWSALLEKAYAKDSNFWRYGEWVDVVVDDRLPTRGDKLVFCHSKSRNEFWSALLEKAYAKLYGDYETLTQCRTADALVDFTGGVAEKLELAKLTLNDFDSQIDLFTKLKDALDNRALINCNIDCSPDDAGSETANGLVLGHGYNITKIAEIEVPKKLQGKLGTPKMFMIRLANPWGTKEWNGAWSDGAQEWSAITGREWEKLGIKFESEGEFWMSLEDFVKEFTNVDICHFVNTAIFSLKKTWHESVFHGTWHVAGRAGGSDWNSTTFLSNPQYVFDITGEKDKIMVSLEQHDLSQSRQQLGTKINNIGFYIMKVEENRKYRMHINGDLMFKSSYSKSRSVFGSVELQKGRYVLIPTTKEPGETGKFMLRVYTSNAASSSGVSESTWELTNECPKASCCGKPPALVTTLTVVGATDLEMPPQSKVKSIDPYVKILCEGEKILSEKVMNTDSPRWTIKVTFYRKKPDEPITVEIWNSNTFVDDFMAEARIDVHGNEDGQNEKCQLYGRKKERDVAKPGYLHIFIKSSQDLACL